MILCILIYNILVFKMLLSNQNEHLNYAYSTCNGGCHKNLYTRFRVHTPSCVKIYKKVLKEFSVEDLPDLTSEYHRWTVCAHDGYHHKLFNNGKCFCKKNLERNLKILEDYNYHRSELNDEICR